ncbi:radical SAM family heme chaperone HemW [Chlorobium sp. N1]|uniref:radical SAM family heme chaperone HemW n=1 Tax=Chlorobium sp. N1 TaxID=2491138 RepID=UPI00103E73B4|nr:radical SAM family heme chaperone HemW [Chlorobium sp. N1]TCD47802.1 radical SAM family heme chaperone HemW [Chlorobium sp. N1]
MLSLYVHIPFCRKRCPYCDFYLVTGTGRMEEFFRALHEETASKAGLLKGRRIGAVHFGGGTPSQAPARLIAGWLDQVSGIGVLESGAEVTLEANPEDALHLGEYSAAGINRLSLGVQSFSERKLRSLGRAHAADEAARAVEDALRLFRSVSVDLICGAPGEDLSEWQGDVRRAVELAPNHISVYMLSLEPKTILHRDVRSGRTAVPGEELQAACYRHAQEALPAAGLAQYEISNFALEGHRSRYNLSSWRREPYLGFGPAAHSFVRLEDGEVRSANTASLSGYLRDPRSAEGFREVLTERERFTEEVFLALRINRGLDVGFLRKGHKLGHRLESAIREFDAKGWLFERDGRLFLTSEGFLFADLIAEAFIP